jgi:hypothetical protein
VIIRNYGRRCEQIKTGTRTAPVAFDLLAPQVRLELTTLRRIPAESIISKSCGDRRGARFRLTIVYSNLRIIDHSLNAFPQSYLLARTLVQVCAVLQTSAFMHR